MFKYLIGLLFIGKVFALSFANLNENELLSHLTEPPASYQFSAWTDKDYYGGRGIRPDGTSLHSEYLRPTIIWPVGTNAFIFAAHFEFGAASNADATNSYKTILYRGEEYPVINRLDLGSDIVLILTSKTIPYYHAVWRGYIEIPVISTNFMTLPPPFNIQVSTGTVTNYVARNISSNLFLTISGGPFGNAVCSTPTMGGRTAWAISKGAYISKSYDDNNIVSTLALPTYASWYPVMTEKCQIPYFINSQTNFGTAVGDSGGANFIYDNGKWYLANLITAGSNCTNSETMGALIYNALYFKKAYWQFKNDINGYNNALNLRDKWFANEPKYVNGGVPTLPVQPPPTPVIPPSITNGIIITNYVNITNYLTITNYVVKNITNEFNPLTFQQRKALENLRLSSQQVIDMLGK